MRRAAKYADGWHPVGATAASPLPPPEFEKLMGALKALTEAEGRSFDELFISLKALLAVGGNSREVQRKHKGNMKEIWRKDK